MSEFARANSLILFCKTTHFAQQKKGARSMGLGQEKGWRGKSKKGRFVKILQKEKKRTFCLVVRIIISNFVAMYKNKTPNCALS
jgi:hypothetical protein